MNRRISAYITRSVSSLCTNGGISSVVPKGLKKIEIDLVRVLPANEIRSFFANTVRFSSLCFIALCCTHHQEDIVFS